MYRAKWNTDRPLFQNLPFSIFWGGVSFFNLLPSVPCLLGAKEEACWTDCCCLLSLLPLGRFSNPLWNAFLSFTSAQRAGVWYTETNKKTLGIILSWKATDQTHSIWSFLEPGIIISMDSQNFNVLYLKQNLPLQAKGAFMLTVLLVDSSR